MIAKFPKNTVFRDLTEILLQDLQLSKVSEGLENSLKNTGFMYFTDILKNYQIHSNSDMIFEFYDQNYPIPESFKEIDKFFSFRLNFWS